jgi:hypothetical protein
MIAAHHYTMALWRACPVRTPALPGARRSPPSPRHATPGLTATV